MYAIRSYYVLEQQAKHVTPAHDTLAGRQTVGGPQPAGCRGSRHIAVLEGENIAGRNVLETTAAAAAAFQMIRSYNFV